MRPKENFRPYIASAFGLTLAILVTFQTYIWREPFRIERDETLEKQAKEKAGLELYSQNCVSCHGQNGEGGVGPPLNERGLLGSAPDEVLFSLIRTGVPGTLMPAWSQAFGGPFTDEQITQMVAFIRSWEPNAPLIEAGVIPPDPTRGALMYEQTCFICHGENGKGTDIAPALNDPERLGELDDAWYRKTIARGRPAKGMPTWGTVLSPMQINDLVALIAAWREGDTVSSNVPMATFVTNALIAIREFDRPDSAFYLKATLPLATGEQAQEIEAILTMIDENRLFEAQTRLVALLPAEEMGKASFSGNCAPCHADNGTGGIGPNLHDNSFVQSKSDEEIVDFIQNGRRGTAMVGFEGILGVEEIDNLIALLREWQK